MRKLKEDWGDLFEDEMDEEETLIEIGRAILNDYTHGLTNNGHSWSLDADGDIGGDVELDEIADAITGGYTNGLTSSGTSWSLDIDSYFGESCVEGQLMKKNNMKKLKEGKWNCRLKSGVALRQAIADEDYQGIIDGIRACYQEMLDKGVIDEDDFDRWTEDLDFYDLDDEDIEDTLDYELTNLYDACDNLGCWIELDESLSEDLDNVESTDNTSVVDQPMEAAVKDSKIFKKRFDDATKEPKETPTFGAKNQPKPDKVEESKAELKEANETYKDITRLFERFDWDVDTTTKEELGSDYSYFKLVKSVEEAERFNYHSDYWGDAEDYQENAIEVVRAFQPYFGRTVQITNLGDEVEVFTIEGILIDKQYNDISHMYVLVDRIENEVNESAVKKSSPKLTLDESLFTESYVDDEFLSGEKVRYFNDYNQAKKYADKLGLKQSEYGDAYGCSYCCWNKTGDRNDTEEVVAYYEFKNGKPVRLSDEKAERVKQRTDVDFSEGVDESLFDSKSKRNLKEGIDEFVSEEEIQDKIFDAVSDVFGYFQDKLGIQYGDIAPEDSFELDDLQESMARLIHKVLDYQKFGIGDIDESIKRNLKEEVSDLAYQMAEEIDERFREQGFIHFDDFNEAFEEAYPGLIDWTDDSFNELETDVRGILSNMGWETIFEGEDEGSLKLLESKKSTDKRNLKESDDVSEIKVGDEVTFYSKGHKSNGKFGKMLMTSKVLGINSDGKSFRCSDPQGEKSFDYVGKDEIISVNGKKRNLKESSWRGLAYYEYPNGSGCKIRETPSGWVATDEHGRTLGDTHQTRGGAEADVEEHLKGEKNLKEASTLPKGGKDKNFDTDNWSVIYWELSKESEGESASRKMKKLAKVDIPQEEKYAVVDPVNEFDLRVYAEDESGFDNAKKIADAWGLKYKIDKVNKASVSMHPEDKLQMTIFIPEEMVG